MRCRTVRPGPRPRGRRPRELAAGRAGLVPAQQALADPHGRGFKTGRTRLRVVRRGRDKSILEITLREGRNRQVRRMLAKVGHKVRDLMRVQMGPLTLDGLKPGQCRELTQREVRSLRKLTRPVEGEGDQAAVVEVAEDEGEN